MEGFLRPYALATAGTPVSMRYRRRKRVFELQAEPDGEASAGSAHTLVFVPHALYPEGFTVELQGGQWSYDQRSQILSIRAEDPPAGLKLRLEPEES